MSRRASAEMAKPVVRSDFGPCDRAACLTESHLIPLIPRDPTYPTGSHSSHLIPLSPGESRTYVSLRVSHLKCEEGTQAERTR